VLEGLGRFTVRHRIAVLVASGLLVAAAGPLGSSVVGELTSGGFEDPNAESTIAADELEETFRSGEPNFVLLVTAREGTVDDRASATAGTRLTKELSREPQVQQAVSYWSLGSPPPLTSNDSTQALVLARITGNEDAVDERVGDLSREYTQSDDSITVAVGGAAEIFREVGETIESDLSRAELLSLPLTLVLLVLVFGSVVAASLPLSVGGIAILGTLLVLRVITLFTDVSIYALNLTTAMSLGLAIDYSLFVVSRFREELAGGASVDEAVVRSVATAGRTVVLSGFAVAA
jgi:RND superfamily putative drug exporter